MFFLRETEREREAGLEFEIDKFNSFSEIVYSKVDKNKNRESQRIVRVVSLFSIRNVTGFSNFNAQTN